MKLNKDYVKMTLSEERLWKAGESDTFTYENWKLTLRKEEEIYKPFLYSVRGENKKTGSTWSSRYVSMESAFLHILNEFNENANIRNNYNSIEEYFNDKDVE